VLHRKRGAHWTTLVVSFKFEGAIKMLMNKDILEEAGSSMCRVLKTTVLLQSMDDFASVNTVYEEAFGDHRPARACFAVLSLPAGALVEIEAIALEL